MDNDPEAILEQRERYSERKAAMREALVLLRQTLGFSHFYYQTPPHELISKAILVTNEANIDESRLWLMWRHFEPAHHRGIKSCNQCGAEHPRGLMLFDGDLGDYYCAECSNRYAQEYFWPNRLVTYYETEPEEDIEDNNLYDYSTSPIHALGQDYLAAAGEVVNGKTRLFGCEIEFIARGGSYLSDITSIAQRVGIFKHDGSLDDGVGAEFCTLPMTRKSLSQLEPVLKRMHSKGARAWNYEDCGLHVHVTRDSASWLTWSKAERFMRNRVNQDLITRIAGRAPNEFCKRWAAGPQNIPAKAALMKSRGDQVNGIYPERYDALNFQTGKPTVEFRIFRGNVSYQGVLRATQFCDSLLEFAATQSNNARMDGFDYLIWLRRHAAAYRALARLIWPRGVDADNDAAA